MRPHNVSLVVMFDLFLFHRRYFHAATTMQQSLCFLCQERGGSFRTIQTTTTQRDILSFSIGKGGGILQLSALIHSMYLQIHRKIYLDPIQVIDTTQWLRQTVEEVGSSTAAAILIYLKSQRSFLADWSLFYESFSPIGCRFIAPLPVAGNGQNQHLTVVFFSCTQYTHRLACVCVCVCVRTCVNR